MFIAFSFILIHCHSFKMVEFSIPSSFEPPEPLQHAHTPKKAAVLGTLSYLRDHHIRVRKEDVFHYFQVCAGDLGKDAEHLEHYLLEITSLAHKWKAIILLDE